MSVGGCGVFAYFTVLLAEHYQGGCWHVEKIAMLQMRVAVWLVTLVGERIAIGERNNVCIEVTEYDDFYDIISTKDNFTKS